MSANNICCYSNEANDRDVVIEFHASRLDGGHWSDLWGAKLEYQVRGALWIGRQEQNWWGSDNTTVRLLQAENAYYKGLLALFFLFQKGRRKSLSAGSYPWAFTPIIILLCLQFLSQAPLARRTQALAFSTAAECWYSMSNKSESAWFKSHLYHELPGWS